MHWETVNPTGIAIKILYYMALGRPTGSKDKKKKKRRI
jgi:hypothetical protein